MPNVEGIVVGGILTKLVQSTYCSLLSQWLLGNRGVKFQFNSFGA